MDHGKHVLVDYPFCLSAQSGKDLYDLAESKGMIVVLTLIGKLNILRFNQKQETSFISVTPLMFFKERSCLVLHHNLDIFHIL